MQKNIFSLVPFINFLHLTNDYIKSTGSEILLGELLFLCVGKYLKLIFLKEKGHIFLLSGLVFMREISIYSLLLMLVVREMLCF